MSAAIETTTELAPPTTADPRMRQFVERLSLKGVIPAVFASVALCGERVSEVFVEHNGEICQACVDEQRRRPVER